MLADASTKHYRNPSSKRFGLLPRFDASIASKTRCGILPPTSDTDSRQEQAPAIWEALRKQAEELKPKLLPKSTLGQAVNYFLNEYDALLRYLEDGRFEIDNNLVENDIRPTAVGRKRWLFIGHPDAGWRSAVIYSLLISARRRGLNLQAYLTDVLARLPSMKITQIHELLPGNWKAPSANSP